MLEVERGSLVLLASRSTKIQNIRLPGQDKEANGLRLNKETIKIQLLLAPIAICVRHDSSLEELLPIQRIVPLNQ